MYVKKLMIHFRNVIKLIPLITVINLIPSFLSFVGMKAIDLANEIATQWNETNKCGNENKQKRNDWNCVLRAACSALALRAALWPISAINAIVCFIGGYAAACHSVGKTKKA